MGRAKRKCVFEHAQNAQIHPTQSQSLVRAFDLHWCILYCPMILLTDNEGPDQTARMRRLIGTFAVRKCGPYESNACYHLMWNKRLKHLYQVITSTSTFWTDPFSIERVSKFSSSEPTTRVNWQYNLWSVVHRQHFQTRTLQDQLVSLDHISCVVWLGWGLTAQCFWVVGSKLWFP